MNTKRTTNIKKRKFKIKYTKKNLNNRKKRITSIFKILIYMILLFLVVCFMLMLILYNKYLKELPSVTELENLNIAESSTIYDRNGKALYSIFKEKRTYVSYNHISKNMINAIISGEDKNFWTNPGVDILGIFRAGFNYITGKNKSLGGTSTLTQQLIRNTIIKNRSDNETFWQGAERKLKELYLSYNLTKNGTKKEKILELYLNKIGYGHNSYGIEEAAKTFFNKSSKDLNILESSILASLPKGPTAYSPYNHRDRLVGNPIIYTKKDQSDKVDLLTNKEIAINSEGIIKLKSAINKLVGKDLPQEESIIVCKIDKNIFSLDYKIDEKGCAKIPYKKLDTLIGNISIKFGEKYIGYDVGRKDYILRRMLEDGYINFDEYKKSITKSFTMVFHKNTEKMLAPHFVFYVKEYLEKKYGKETLEKGGLKIYTTLDFEAQKKAEEIIKNQVLENTKKFNAKNAALISIDNTNGDILAMVGAVDYYNEDIKGNVNVITSKLQPGSSFKPFVYSLGMENNKIGTKTPIYDLKTTFPGGYSPNNYDGKFIGKTDISTALNHSRNITAVKMYFLAGGSEKIIDFMEKLGVKSLDRKRYYGAPLALGSGEITPLELASAYTIFANMGEKVEINPILKIIDSKGNTIEEKGKNEEIITRKKIIEKPGQAFLINHILSNTKTRPAGRNKFLSLSDRKVAAKTGTSTKPIKKNGKEIEYPSNLWTIGYTPQITTVAWAGNSDGETLKYSGNGLEGAGPIWKNFMEYIHDGKKALKWIKPSDIKEINISSITGYLPNPESYNNKYLTNSYFLNVPKEIDKSYQIVEYDALCNGIVTNDTPKAAIKKAIVLEFHSLMPSNPAWENPVLKWAKSKEATNKYGTNEGVIGNLTYKKCERNSESSNIIIKSNIDEKKLYSPGNNNINLGYKSDNPIYKIEILMNDTLRKTINTKGKTKGTISTDLFIPAIYNNKKISLEIRALDKNYYSESEIKNIIVKSDNSKPKINLKNPLDGSIKIYEDEYFNLRADIIDSSALKSVKVFINGKLFKSYGNVENISLAINKEKDYTVGNYDIKIEAVDNKGNKGIKNIKCEVIPK